jgi:hypothetical protein
MNNNLCNNTSSSDDKNKDSNNEYKDSDDKNKDRNDKNKYSGLKHNSIMCKNDSKAYDINDNSHDYEDVSDNMNGTFTSTAKRICKNDMSYGASSTNMDKCSRNKCMNTNNSAQLKNTDSAQFNRNNTNQNIKWHMKIMYTLTILLLICHTLIKMYMILH